MADTYYIPKDLDDCFVELDRLLGEKAVAEFKSGEVTTTEVHFGLGMNLRNNWGLWTKESRLVKWFNGIGIKHPDDMSGIILDAYVDRLNDTEFDLDGQVKYYQDYWNRPLGERQHSRYVIVKDSDDSPCYYQVHTATIPNFNEK